MLPHWHLYPHPQRVPGSLHHPAKKRKQVKEQQKPLCAEHGAQPHMNLQEIQNERDTDNQENYISGHP